MASEVILPRVDMDMATGAISHWNVAEGDEVEKGQVLFEIETDKAAMEVEAEASGVVRGLSGAIGEPLPVGTVVAWICAPGEEPPARADKDQNRTEAATMPATNGYAPPASPVTPGESNAADGKVRATPLARRLARQHGIDIRALTGSGPRGRVGRADVDAVIDERNAEARPLRESDAVVRAQETNAPAPMPDQRSPLRPLREGDGTPLLFLHGFGSESASWRPLLPHLHLANRLLALDLPGHGRADARAVSDFDDLVRAVEDMIAEARPGAFHLVGHSLGAAVGARIAAGGAFNVRSLTLLAPAGFGPGINGGFLNGFIHARDEASLAAWMRLLVEQPETMTPALVRAALKAKTGRERAQEDLIHALFPDATQVFSIRGDLDKIAVPARVVVGSDDRIIPAAYASGLPAAVALHTLRGVGHMPQLEARELTGRLIGETVRSAG